MAKMHFKYGAMNSGKSTALINTAYNYEERGMQVAILKPSIDTKGDRLIVARAGLEREVDILADPEMDVRKEVTEFQRKMGEIACVIVDEAQFLRPIQVDQLFEVAKMDDTSVIAYGLRTDFQSQMFPGSKRLMELSDNFELLKTMCSCGTQAHFNARRINGAYVFDGDQVAIDGEDRVTYDSLCGKCYLTEQARSLAL